ncbi:hypothetical protein CCH79_00016252 [Gambusia affinis]|uniref:B30.2/SPRY domain-containing protein n=1 Tax=Gambusia affinis TaxID=33528 RepID=A0A315VXG1_GAMAF|nr:hypothetical protein CCH79_00016252 [Gambusia affinis]
MNYPSVFGSEGFSSGKHSWEVELCSAGSDPTRILRLIQSKRYLPSELGMKLNGVGRRNRCLPTGTDHAAYFSESGEATFCSQTQTLSADGSDSSSYARQSLQPDPLRSLSRTENQLWSCDSRGFAFKTRLQRAEPAERRLLTFPGSPPPCSGLTHSDRPGPGSCFPADSDSRSGQLTDRRKQAEGKINQPLTCRQPPLPVEPGWFPVSRPSGRHGCALFQKSVTGSSDGQPAGAGVKGETRQGAAGSGRSRSGSVRLRLDRAPSSGESRTCSPGFRLPAAFRLFFCFSPRGTVPTWVYMSLERA